jgi:guanylate kinase
MLKNKHKLFIISGPGGVGKATIIKGVLKHEELNSIRGLNVTTRAERSTDKFDPHFKFVTKDEFEGMIKNNEVLEYNYLDGEYYGILGPSLFKQLRRHNVLMEADVNGSLKIKRKIKEAILIFLTAKLQFLRRRMRKRHDTAPEHIEYRLKLAKKEIRKAKELQKD